MGPFLRLSEHLLKEVHRNFNQPCNTLQEITIDRERKYEIRSLPCLQVLQDPPDNVTSFTGDICYLRILECSLFCLEEFRNFAHGGLLLEISVASIPACAKKLEMSVKIHGSQSPV